MSIITSCIIIAGIALGIAAGFAAIIIAAARMSSDVNYDPEIDAGLICPDCLGWTKTNLDTEDLNFNPKICACKKRDQ